MWAADPCLAASALQCLADEAGYGAMLWTIAAIL
jgi:hypothetical protein